MTRRAMLSATLMAVALANLPLRSAYRGHGADADVRALLEVYPELRGTATDSCETCHRAGQVPGPAYAPAARRVNHCDYCHAVTAFGKKPAAPTLNAYGVAYRAAGRGAGAIRDLAGRDADGDRTDNVVELRKGTNPGEAASHPGAPLAPHRVIGAIEIQGLSPVVRARVFLNSTKSRTGDTYFEYRGNRLDQVLDAVGLAPGAESVDLISIDGYEVTLTLDEIRRQWPQAPLVPGLDRARLGPCGWVAYGSDTDGAAAMPEAHVLLAFDENGTAFDAASIDPASGRITGKGPLRAIVPQFQPGVPDLPLSADAGCLDKVRPAHRFSDAYDHNAGKSVSAVAAIRVNPLPAGTRDVDWRAGQGPAEARSVVLFGALARGDSVLRR